MQVPILLDVIRTFSKDGGCFACGIWMTTLTGRLWPARPSDHRQLPGIGIQWRQFGLELEGVTECSVP